MRARKLIAAALLLGTFPIAHLLTPQIVRDALPICPFRIATGKPCPLCGLTRAIAVATHRQWHAAFAYNPLWPVFAAAMIGLSAMLVIDALADRHIATRVLHKVTSGWIWIAAGLIAFDVWRIVQGSGGRT